MNVCLRPATDADRRFFRDVYATTREDELAVVPWTDDAKTAFVDHQFGAQSAHYALHYPGASIDVVLIGGEPAGRLFVYRTKADIRIVDIALLPAFRGRGAGATLIEAVFEEARASRCSVSIHVEQANPARRFYERLGFVALSEHGLHVLMHWTPDGQLQANTAS